MRMRDLLNAIVNTFAADSRFTGVAISKHGGDWDLDEIQVYAKRSPAVVVSLMRAETTNQGGSVNSDCLFMAVVMTEDKADAPKLDASIDYADATLRLITKPGQRWGLTAEAVGGPRNIAARNLYSRKADAKGIALWGVAWRQTIDLADATDLAVPLETINAKWDVSPRANDAPMIPAPGSVQDAEDEIDLT